MNAGVFTVRSGDRWPQLTRRPGGTCGTLVEEQESYVAQHPELTHGTCTLAQLGGVGWLVGLELELVEVKGDLFLAIFEGLQLCFQQHSSGSRGHLGPIIDLYTWMCSWG